MVAGHCFRLVRKDTGTSAKRKENQSSSRSRKKQKTFVSYGFQGRGYGYQGQGRVGAFSQMGADDMLLLPSAQAYETGLSTEAGISELWDIIIPIISGTCANLVCSSLPLHGPGKPMQIPRCCISTYYFTYGPNGPRHVYAVVPQIDLVNLSDI